MNSKIANETLGIIKKRRSVRDYNSTQIVDEQLNAILEAGLYAPNAGDQAWHFTVVQNESMLKRLNSLAKETATQVGDPSLAALGGDEGFECMYGAPTLVIISADENSISPEVDCAAATENLLIAAESMGLGSCWIYFVILAFYSQHAQQLREELKIPTGYKPYCAAIFGYKDADTELDAPQRKPNLITYIK